MFGPDRLVQAGLQAGKDPLALMFPRQRAFASDLLVKGSRTANHAGRRSGKSHGEAYASKSVMDVPRSTVGFWGLTKTSAESIIWPAMSRLNKDLGLGWRENGQKYRFESTNGSMFYVLSAKDARHIELTRGLSVDLAIVDECGSYSPTLLRYFVEDVLEPTLADRNGRLVLSGTPGPVPQGFYHDACQGSGGFGVHRWTMLDNPHIEDARGFILKQLRDKAWVRGDFDHFVEHVLPGLVRGDPRTIEWVIRDGLVHPTFIREYMGLWVTDTDALVFHLDDLNLIEAMPDDYDPESPAWAHIIGADYGYVDSCAWTVWAWRRDHQGDRNAYTVESFKWQPGLPNAGIPERYLDGLTIDTTQGLIPSDGAVISRNIDRRYQPLATFGDTGGIGKGYAEEANRRFDLGIKPARKLDVQGQVAVCDDGLRAGGIKIVAPNCQALIDELRVLQWDVKPHEVTIRGVVHHEDRKKIDKTRFDDHCADSWRYPYPQVLAYLQKDPKPPPPKPGSAEYDRELARRMVRRATKKQKKAWWEQ